MVHGIVYYLSIISENDFIKLCGLNDFSVDVTNNIDNTGATSAAMGHLQRIDYFEFYLYLIELKL